MAVNVVVIKMSDPRFANTTPGMIKQAQDYLRKVTTDEIAKVRLKQRGEEIVYRVDNRFDKALVNSEWKIQAFWQLPGSGDVLRNIWSLVQSETYKYVTRRTGILGGSWRIYRKDPTPGSGKNVSPAKRVGPSFPAAVKPGTTYSFINVAKYGSLMSRYSAIIALRGSIAKSAARAKPGNLNRRITQLTRSIFYQNTPAGYSTVVRIRKGARRKTGAAMASIRAFDLPPQGGDLSSLKRISGVSVAFWKHLRAPDIIKQGRAR